MAAVTCTLKVHTCQPASIVFDQVLGIHGNFAENRFRQDCRHILCSACRHSQDAESVNVHAAECHMGGPWKLKFPLRRASIPFEEGNTALMCSSMHASIEWELVRVFAMRPAAVSDTLSGN